jgi:eukaryotic-like serine/threonine-protein kinase
MIGKTVGKYRIVEKIGRGGMGIVYCGVDETLDRRVAIKVINPELVEDEHVRRFRAEAQTLARVNHANIATVYELFRDDDQLLMVMELVRGQSFEQLLERSGALPPERAGMLIAQVLDALTHAHGAGVIHRDLKPANLMLTDSGIVKVMDFGIARVAGTERMTNDGFMVGTPAYMPPEQVRGDNVDGRADLYAVGVVFYRMLTGSLPFKAEAAIAMIQAQLNQTAPLPRTLRPDLPEWIDGVVMRALAKKPADRYQTAEEFRRAVDSLAPRPNDVTVATPAMPMPLAGTPPASATPGTTTLVLNRSHLAMAGGIAVMLLLAIGVLGGLALRRQAVPVQVVTTSAPAAAPVVPPSAPPAPIPATPTRVDPAPPESKPVERKTVDAKPASMPAVEPALEGLLPGPRGAGRGAAPAANPRSSPARFQPIVIRDVRAIVLKGSNTRSVDALLAFSERSITASDARDGLSLKSFPYDAVQHATFTRGRLPKGNGGAEVQMPGGIPQGNVFSRGPRLWVTLETADDRLVLRLDPPTVSPVLDLLGQRTKAPIERFDEPAKH